MKEGVISHNQLRQTYPQSKGPPRSSPHTIFLCLSLFLPAKISHTNLPAKQPPIEISVHSTPQLPHNPKFPPNCEYIHYRCATLQNPSHFYSQLQFLSSGQNKCFLVDIASLPSCRLFAIYWQVVVKAPQHSSDLAIVLSHAIKQHQHSRHTCKPHSSIARQQRVLNSG